MKFKVMAELKQILCIDDDQDILAVAQMALEMVGGFRVITGCDGRKASTLAKEVAADLILLDVMMPEVDGPATLALLQADPQVAPIPVIFMTAKIQPAEIQHYLELGAAGVIAKPFDPMVLAEQIRGIWEKYHGRT